MKKRLLILVTLAVAFGGVLLAVPHANAVSSFNSSDNGGDVTLAKNAVHNGSYYATGQDITIDGTIKGDLYCAGQTVRVNGTVDGDVICAAQKITVNGVVGQDVRSAAQMITVAGKVGGSLTSFAQDVEVVKGATVGKDLNGAAQTFTIDGVIGRDIAVASQKLTIAGMVNGSATVNVESLTLSSQPSIKGGLEYTSPKKQNLAANAVAGKVNFHQAETSETSHQNSLAVRAAAFFFMTLALVISSLILSLIIPRSLERSYRLAHQKFGTTLLVGVAVSLGLPILAVLLMLSMFGLPLGLLAFVILALVGLLAFPFAAYYLARALFGQVVHNVVALMLVGAILLSVLMAIPVINIITFLAVMIVGMGGVVVTATNGYRKPTYSLVVETPTKSEK